MTFHYYDFQRTDNYLLPTYDIYHLDQFLLILHLCDHDGSIISLFYPTPPDVA